ncbi:penicillin-binding protein 2 [Niveispirillum sp.]|uniref:penicillin-binding protein 2 n=1 Tax=Niveispirillum sp. TaxID=1917217 RepID=UPI001B791C4E|nr:penicillin-binding protein 2 [Niveispirillum sp.]MBP7336200.1 penicillin-binding protein 2 [Niveispirillum sp.]
MSAFDRDAERQRMLSRRTLVLGGLQGAAVATLMGRLYYLQIVESDRYKVLAEDNRISLRLVAPPRGLITDRFGVPLAVNEQNFSTIIVSERAGDVQQILDEVGKLIPLTEADERRIQRDIQRSRSFAPITIKENLTWDQVAAIEVNLPDLPGVSIDVGQVRSYPFGEALSHVLGYVGAASEKDVEGSTDPLLTLPGFRVGKGGIEKQYDQALRGAAGNRQLEVNAVGRVIRELSRDAGQPGREVALTIDAKLQHYMHQRLSAEESAAAVVMDVHTGGIQALCSSPSFDPNQFAMGIGYEAYQALLKDERTPLINKVIAGQYPPGSTFKMLTALAALESGIINADHRVSCGGHIELGSHRFHCWRRGGHGTLDMVGALMNSCDVYFYDIAGRIGMDRIAEMARKFGLGGKVGLELPGERPGLIPDPKWKRQALKQPWHQGETLIASMGQGYVLTTPLQLAVMTARLASGKAIQPHLLKSIEGQFTETTEWPAIDVKADNLAVVVKGMNAVTNVPGGTGYRARINVPGMEMAGKSGSAQVRRISMAERSTGVRANDALPWRERDHALFVAFAPVQAPKYACAVIVEHGGGGGAVAAPIARDILLECQMLEAARATVAQHPSPATDTSPTPPPPEGGTP